MVSDPISYRSYGLFAKAYVSSYVHGIMDGEVIHQPRTEEFQELKVEILPRLIKPNRGGPYAVLG